METSVFGREQADWQINLRTPAGVKTVRVRFPSDDEWITRQRRRKVLVKQLERGIPEATVAKGEDVAPSWRQFVTARSRRSIPSRP